MNKADFQLKVLTEETRYLMDTDDPTLDAFARRLLGLDYDSTKIDCEACSQAKVAAVLYATQAGTGSKVRTFCCMNCGVSAAQTPPPGWKVALYKLGIEIKMEATIDGDPNSVDGNAERVQELGS